tara:strand:+ start:1599 stop:2114 length:516 start_codon:yes stop_codon:yes gene_type:complete
MEGGALKALFQPTALLLVVGTTLFLSLTYHRLPQLLGAFAGAISTNPLGRETAQRHIAVLSTCRTIALSAGGLGFILGLIIILQNLSDPAKLGPGVAIALISTLYALILSELILAPLSNRLQCHFASPRNDNDVDSSPKGPLEAATPSVSIFLLSTLGSLLMLFIILTVIN